MNGELVIIDEKGKKVFCDILFSFDCTFNGKSYLVYTDNTKNSTGNVRALASIYYPNEKSGDLYPIETEFERKMLEIILNKLQELMIQGKDSNDIYKEVEEALELLFEQN